MPKCRSLVAALIVAGLAVTALPHRALARDKFTLAISIYAGWMPWYYAKDHGILKKWAERYKIAIEVVEMDYIPSIEAYVAGKVDAAVMTNMEALDMPARSGVDSTALIVGDYSNGNDALLVRGIADIKGLKGTSVYLVELSVSHYLLARALAMHGLNEYKAQLRTTAMFWTPEAAIDYTRGTEIKEKMDFVRNFCFKHGLLGENAPSVDIVGISYPDGTMQGDSRNVKLRFDTRVMEKARTGQLRQN